LANTSLNFFLNTNIQHLIEKAISVDTFYPIKAKSTLQLTQQIVDYLISTYVFQLICSNMTNERFLKENIFINSQGDTNN